MSYTLPINIDKAYLIQENSNEYLSTFAYDVTTQDTTATRNVLPTIAGGMVKLYGYNQYITLGQTFSETEVFTSELECRVYLAPRYHVVDHTFPDGLLGYGTMRVSIEIITEDNVDKIRLTAEISCDNGEHYIDTAKSTSAYNIGDSIGFYFKALSIDNQYDLSNTVGSYRHLFQTEPPFNLLSNQIIAVYKPPGIDNWSHVGIQLNDHSILLDNVPFGKAVKNYHIEQSIGRSVMA